MPDRARAIGFILATAIGAAAHAGPTVDEVRAWLAREHSASLQFPALRHVYIDFTVEQHHRVDPDELEALRRHVATILDHAAAFRLRMLERRAKGPTVERRRAWIVDENTWRINCDFIEHPALRYNDIAVSRRAAWSSTDSELALMNPRRGYPPDRDLSRASFTIQEPVSRLLHGGADYLPSGDLDAESSRIEGPDLRLVVQPSERMPGRRAVVTARWDERASRAFMSEVALYEASGPAAHPSMRFAATGWRYSEELSAWVADSVEVYGEDGLPVHTVIFNEASVVAPSEAEALLRPPESGRDLIRGEVAWRTVRDFRNDPASPALLVDAAGGGPPGPAASGRAFRAWRAVLLAVAAALVLAVIITRLRQRHLA